MYRCFLSFNQEIHKNLHNSPVLCLDGASRVGGGHVIMREMICN